MPNAEGTTAAAERHRSGSAVNQRADARRSRAKILAATPLALRKNPDASVADIAAAAGVGRMTLYGHFANRAALIDATLADSLEQAEGVLGDIPLDGDPTAALEALIASSWTLLERVRSVLVVAQRELPAARIREMHEVAEGRMQGLFERGQREGVFRPDLPVSWLLTVTHLAMNAAAEEVTAGRIERQDAADLIIGTLLPAFTVREMR